MRGCVLALLLTGCVSIPPYHGETQQDAGPKPLMARLIGNAYRDAIGQGTTGMLKFSYSISTFGIEDGDLVVFIANVDNGDTGFWMLPSGFTPIANGHTGMDGQSYTVGWKIAAGEPGTYSNSYASMNTSGAATVTLVAITGYNPGQPINASLPIAYPDDADPAVTTSPGVTTTVDNTLLVYAAGVDWHGQDGKNTNQLPDGFSTLTFIGDRNTEWEWTSQVVATKIQSTAGPTGELAGSMAGVKSADDTVHIPGAGWDVVLAIAPKPML